MNEPSSLTHLSLSPIQINQIGLIWTLVVLGVLAILNLFSVIWMPEFVQTSSYAQKISSSPKRASDLTAMEDSDFSFKIEE